MNVIQYYVVQWFNNELDQWDGWKAYQIEVQGYLKSKDGHDRLMLYHRHLNLIRSNWGMQYLRTAECAYLRELFSTKKNKKFLQDAESALIVRFQKVA